ncbi:MAG: GNAT family N-acetyltransferase [Albidovulum sp.]
MNVRRISPEEAALWRRIRLEALSTAPDAFSAPLSDWQDRPIADFAAQVAANPVFLAFDGSVPVGSISWMRDDEIAGRGWIYAVFVSPGARGRGIGQALIAAVLTDADAAGMTELWLEVGGQNTPAISAYGRAGFVAFAGKVRPSQCGSKCEVSMRRALP